MRKPELYYTHATVNWKTLLLKKVEDFAKEDIGVTRYGIAGMDADGYAANENKLMKDILNSNPKAIPEIISSIGYGINMHTSPYWTGTEKIIIDEVKKRGYSD